MLEDQKIVDAIREVASSAPEYVYKSPNQTNRACLYFDYGGNPSCLIGHALAKCGLTEDDVTEGSAALDVLGAKGIDEDVALAATVAQDVQDGGGTWGYALEAFNEALKEHGYEG